MRFHARPALVAAILLTMPARADGLKQIGSIALPGNPLTEYGAIFVDQDSGRAFLTDRDNKAIDVIDTRTDTFVGRIDGFIGKRDKSAVAGPQGVVTVNGGAEAWASDGDSTIKVIDLKAGKIVDSIATGGKFRVGELAYDAQDQIVLAANPNDDPPFITLYSSQPGHRLVAKIPLPTANDGIERPGYFSPTGMFYVPLPKIDHSEIAGGLAEIDPRAGTLVAIHPFINCLSHNLAVVNNALLYIGCDFPAGGLAVFDPRQGKVLAYVPQLGGGGQNAANDKIGHYYAAVNRHPGGPRLKVIDTKTNRLVQAIPSVTGAHAVAVSAANDHVYLPTAKSDVCGGCILVYAPE